MRLTKSTNRQYTVPFESMIDRAFWSREVAYDGDEVKLHIETSYVADGAAATVTIKERTQSGEETVVTEIASSDLSGGELILDHTVELPEAQAGDDAALPDLREYIFIVEFADYHLTNETDPPVLTIDAGRITFSE
jgi:hypothetical protein